VKALWLALCVVSLPALAWESTCSKFGDKTLSPEALAAARGEPCTPSSGPSTARERWVGTNDEHRQLFELTRAKAGLPPEVSATQNQLVFTADATVDINGTASPTLVPAPFEATQRLATRSWSVAEFAQLPDFSYALWDWASGHEVCPLAGASSLAECHDFAAHMGPVNSNHFVPQSRTSYAHYHRLALDRAAACRTMAMQVATQPRFGPYVRACELEALALEAVGQHFLQDSWSMGHMWARWGSATLDDFPGDTVEEKRDRAVLTALVSGLFHGARSVLQTLPAWTSYDVNDAMCAPWDDVRFMTPGGDFSRGIGDNYLSLLSSAAPYTLQSSTFFQCAVSGVLEVYAASGEQHGAAQPEPGFVSIDPTSEPCFGQRATNQAIAAGAAVNLKIVGLQSTIPIDARFVSFLLPKVARAQGKVAVSPRLRNEFRFQLQRTVTVARVRAKDAPDGTDLANGGWGPFLGVKQNGEYDRAPDYLDPAWPWPARDEHAQYLQRTFHQAHAAELCSSVTQATLDTLRARAHDGSLPATEQAAACTACTELAVRHVRIGTAGSYDTSKEPLCSYLSTSTFFLYAQTTGVTDAQGTATRWCCP